MSQFVPYAPYSGFMDDVKGFFAANPGEASHPVISKGDSGDNVRLAQEELGLAVTGQFDFGMENAVRAFQMSRSISSTGVVDGQTWALLLGSRYVPAKPKGAAAALATGGAAISSVLQTILPGAQPVATAPAHEPVETPWMTYALAGGFTLLFAGAVVYMIWAPSPEDE